MTPVYAQAAPDVERAATNLATFDAAWTAIRDTYVDASKTDTDWAALRDRYRPRAAAASTPDDVRQVIRELLATIGRSHFDLLPAQAAARLAAAASDPATVGTIGLDLTPIDASLVVARVPAGGPAARAGIEPGWTLVAVDDERVGLSDDRAIDGASQFRMWALAQALLRGTTGTAARLTLRAEGGATRTVTVERARETGQPVTLGHLPTFFARLDESTIERNGRSIAVIRFNVWMVPLAPALDAAVDHARQASGIVLDLRGNPGGILSMLMGVSGHFLDAPVRLGTVRTKDSELNLVANPRTVAPDGRHVEPFKGPLAILVDRTSYSASEIFAAGMQSIGRARIFGQQTPGGALPALLRELPNGDVLEYAFGDFVTASGQRIEGVGVTPDVTLVPTRATLAAGRDVVMEAAVQWISSEPLSQSH